MHEQKKPRSIRQLKARKARHTTFNPQKLGPRTDPYDVALNTERKYAQVVDVGKRKVTCRMIHAKEKDKRAPGEEYRGEDKKRKERNNKYKEKGQP